MFVAKIGAGSGNNRERNYFNGATTRGAWAVDSSDTLQPLFCEGITKIAGKTLKKFTAFQAEENERGVPRSFNNANNVIWRAEFTDGTSAIIKTDIH
jgi:hypothetical protein